MVDGLWLVEGGQVSGGSILKWLVEDVLGTTDYESLERQAAKKPVGSSGILVLDFWMGSRTPYKDPHLRGSILGLRLSHDAAELYRALLESIAYGTRNVLRTFEEGGIAPTDIRVCGGLAQNHLWLQMLSDTLGLPVRAMTAQNPTLTAGALCAATAAGHYANWSEAGEVFVERGWFLEPNAASHEKYSVGFERYRRSVELLTPLLHELDAPADTI
jgi:ribulose kinase